MRGATNWGQVLFVTTAVAVLFVQWRFVDLVGANTADEPAVAAIRTTAEINLRAGPSLDSDVLLVLPDGAEVLLVGLGENGFVPVLYERQLGWLFAAYVGPVGVTSLAGVDVARATARLNLRSGPSLEADLYGVTPNAATIAVLGEVTNGFVRVSVDGRIGYVAAEYLRPCHVDKGC